jgi:hypothetical protein
MSSIISLLFYANNKNKNKQAFLRAFLLRRMNAFLQNKNYVAIRLLCFDNNSAFAIIAVY